MTRRLVLLAALAAAALTPAQAQDRPQPSPVEAARAADPYDVPPHVGYLLQADALSGPEVDPDGFLLRTARLRFAGEASATARYFVQAELARGPAVLDARLAVRLGGPVELVAGLYKTPFSRELLTFRGALPAAERARAVRALAPGRQVGANLRVTGERGGDTFRAEAGLFNGNGGRTFANDGDGLLAVGRAEAALAVPVGTLRLGASAARGRDDAAPIPTLDPAFEGTRTVVGADLDLTTPRVYVLAEALAGRLDGPGGDRRPWGGALTATVEAFHHVRLVGRLDHFDPDAPEAPHERPGAVDEPHEAPNRVALGLDLEPQPHVRALVDYGFPTDDPAHGEVRLRLQLALR
ncbi:porin [Rubricoccus marinus]|uniref:Porin domain-containing protein n=1 Tax=Rubricoccus marinus TaxID=716817 RepID=A0A259TUG1_9BACT|nr:porin [Rubricoccus marinus]OZC01412.1 hypothetical protein BSZ36_17150 [Rubricoccus marinus]